MIHDCRSSSCDSPHYANDHHSANCLCDMCHEHDWTLWNIYPECENCEVHLYQWLEENTDYFDLQRHYKGAA